MPSVKMVGNMIEWNSPTEISAHIATWPVATLAISMTAAAPMLAMASA